MAQGDAPASSEGMAAGTPAEEQIAGSGEEREENSAGVGGNRRQRLIGVVFLGVLLFIPGKIVQYSYSAPNGFLSLIHFGREFRDRALPEIRERIPTHSSQDGYDGQFYAQIALDPTLSDKRLAPALDNPSYRARRIGLPLISFCLGLGQPSWILQIYALLNFAFWLLLLGALLRFIGLRRPRDMLLAAALLWSTGTLVSLSKALTDFPAAVVAVLAVLANCRWIAAAGLLSAAGLFKETSVLSLGVVTWRKGADAFNWQRIALSAAIVMLPILLWIGYIHLRLPTTDSAAATNLTFPFRGIVNKFWGSIVALTGDRAGTSSSGRLVLVFELLCPLSLAVQAAYLVVTPRIDAAAWRFGIGFAALSTILGAPVWAEQVGYCRILLPLTFSFNLLIHKHETGRRYAALFTIGNGGMFWMALLFLIVALT